MKNTGYGFCIEHSDKCSYCGGKSFCDWEDKYCRPHDKCFSFTTDAKRILSKIEDIEVLEIIGRQIVDSKGNELELILDTCYHGKNRESSIEHLKKVFFEDYGMRMLNREE